MPVTTVKEATSRANAEYRREQEEQIKAKATLVGDPRVDVGIIVNIRGLPSMLAGNYYVDGVNQVLGTGGYETIMSMKRNALGDLPVTPAQKTASSGQPNLSQPLPEGDLMTTDFVDDTGRTVRVYR